MAGVDQKVAYSLSCDELRLCVEFSLRPGVHGRIGSSPDAEISLPLVGLAAEECLLSMDGSGLLWISRFTDQAPIRIDPPSYFHVGSYRFLMREMLSADHSSNLASKIDLDNSRASVSPRNRQNIITATVGIVILVGAIWLVGRGTNENSRVKNADRSPKTTQPAPDEANFSTPVSKEKAQEPAVEPPTNGEPFSESDVTEHSNFQAHREPARLDLEKLAAKVSPCVFLIEVSDATGERTWTGTGFSVSADGLVATNYHVVEDGQVFTVVTDQGAKFEEVRVVVEDPTSDLALLKIEGKSLPFLHLADTSNVSVGKRVAAYGRPEGIAGTLSEGIISASQGNLNEKFRDDELPNIGRLIQTTTAISPGSSGSPLFDGEGKVLGVIKLNYQRSGRSQSLNFAVPVEALRPLIDKPKSEWSDVRIKQIESTANALRGGDPSATDPPSDPEVLEVLELLTRMEADDWVESMKIASRLVGRYPNSAYAHFKLGYCATELRLDEQAVLSYRKVVELVPIDSYAWNNLGVALSNQELYPQALVAFDKSVALKPDNVMSWDHILIASVILKNWPKATIALRTLSELDVEKAKNRARSLAKISLPNEGFRNALTNTLAQRIVTSTGDGPPVFRVVGVSPGDVLSVRSGPGSNFPKLDGISNGNEVFVVGAARFNVDTEWLPIEYGNFSGWVASKFLVPLE